MAATGHSCRFGCRRFLPVWPDEQTFSGYEGMSQMGLGRVKTPILGKPVRSQDTGSVSGHDRSHQQFDPDDVHDPCQIVGQNR
jgi:hypothetical protein